MKTSPFYRQADLLIRILPEIAREPDFALHGGTAINFFIRDLPRLSVDIDLTYLPIESREDSLKQITTKLKALAQRLKRVIPGVRVEEKTGEAKGILVKLLVNQKGALVKIEPNQVIRGVLFPCEEHDLSKEAETVFEKFVSAKTLSFAELYGAKICAALDRQHPRDLFDIKLLLENEGVTEAVRKAFLVYLVSHNRPMTELLNPKLKEIRSVLEKEFSGMTRIPVTCEELEEARKKLIKTIRQDLAVEERQFLLSFKEKAPKWELLGIEGVKKLPAVQWKLANLGRMEHGKHSVALTELKKVLQLS